MSRIDPTSARPVTAPAAPEIDKAAELAEKAAPPIETSAEPIAMARRMEGGLEQSIAEANLNRAAELTPEGAAVLQEYAREEAGIAQAGGSGVPLKQDSGAAGKYEATLKKSKEWADFGNTMIDKLKLGDRALPEFDRKKLSEFGALLANRREAVAEVGARMRGITNAIASGQLGPAELRRAQNELGRLTDLNKTLSADTAALERTAKGLYDGLKPHQKAVAGMEEFAADIKSVPNLKGAVDKTLVGLDMASKFVELQQQDPGNPGKNLVRAISGSLAKPGLDKLIASKLPNMSAAEQAAGVLKFGLNLMGFDEKTAVGKSVEVLTQAMPGDVAVKGVEQAVEQVFATADWVRTGNPKEWMELDKRNLENKNGLVFQGVAMLGDLATTGGKNIPNDTFGMQLARDLGFWKEDVAPQTLGRSAGEKAHLLNKMVAGEMNSPDNARQVVKILSNGTPHMTAQVLKQVDPRALVQSLAREEARQVVRSGEPGVNLNDPNRWHSPVAVIYQMANQYRSTSDPATRSALEQGMKEMLNEIGSWKTDYTKNQLQDLFNAGRFRDLPRSVREELVQFSR